MEEEKTPTLKLLGCTGEAAVAMRKWALALIYATNTIHMTMGVQMVIESKMAVYMRGLKGDTAKFALMNSRGLSLMMVPGMIFTPFYAVLSETKGRKILLMIGTCFNVLMRSCDLIFQTPIAMVLTSGVSRSRTQSFRER